ncbi:MAG: hypothetical protein NZ518_09530 [Dehalococcoidia bacterium]|nr:hypothetical protein [Dehalococcoidia bacterium]
MSDLVLGQDILGEDVLGEDMGEDVLGFFRGATGRRGWYTRLRRGAPGAPAPSEQMLPLPLGTITFTSTLDQAQFVASPQVAFRGERLVLTVARIGTSAQNALVLVDDISVGTDRQTLAPLSMPADVFSATALDTRLAIAPAQPGIVIAIALRVTPQLAPGDSVIVAGAILGRAIR